MITSDKKAELLPIPIFLVSNRSQYVHKGLVLLVHAKIL